MKALSATDSYSPKPHNWLFKLTFSFIAGILFAHYAAHFDIFVPVLFGAIAAVVHFIFFRLYRGISAFFTFFFVGFLLYVVEFEKIYRSNSIVTEIYPIKIERILKQKDDNIHIKGLVFDSIGNPIFRAVIYAKKDSITSNLLPGDNILSSIVFKPLEDIRIPYAFSQKKYYRNKGISHFAFLNSKKILRITHPTGFNLFRTAYIINRQVVESVKKWPGNAAEKEVLIALITGTKDFLREDIRTTYADTGIIHVLAVSGLHTGLIYIFISGLLRFLWGNRLPVPSAVIIIASLWFYAVFTGLTPSVIRAATMFTFIQIGSSLKRKTGIYHSLSISALLLLATSPFLLFDIGFQLSYAAVFGIVMLSRFLGTIFVFSDTFIVKKIGELLSVSIAAQLFTLPFTLFYFSKFPSYFFIANIFAIPLVSLTLYIGFPLSVMSCFTDVFDPLGIVPSLLIRSNNYLAQSIQNLPASSIRDIYISEPQFIVLLISVVFLSFGIIYRKKIYLYIGILSAICIQLFSIVHHANLLKEKIEFTLYIVNDQPFLTVHVGGSTMRMYHNDGELAKVKYGFYFEKYLLSRFINEAGVEWHTTDGDLKILLTDGRTVFVKFLNPRMTMQSSKMSSQSGKDGSSAKVLVRLLDGKDILLNRDGDRIFIR